MNDNRDSTTTSSFLLGLFSSAGRKLVRAPITMFSYLNPFNYGSDSSTSTNKLAYDILMARQQEYTQADRTLYPFTTNNPFESTFTKLVKYWFG